MLLLDLEICLVTLIGNLKIGRVFLCNDATTTEAKSAVACPYGGSL